MSGPAEPDLASVVAGLERRLRLLELGAPAGPAPVAANPAGRDWLALAKLNAWSCVYVFIGIVDLVFSVKAGDPMLAFGAVAMFAFAWLSWRGEQ